MQQSPSVEKAKDCTCGADIGFIRTHPRGKQAPVEVPAARAYVWNEAAAVFELRRVYIAHHTTCPHIDLHLRK